MNEKEIESSASDDTAQPNQLLRGLNALMGCQVNVVKQNVLIISGKLRVLEGVFCVGTRLWNLTFTALNVRELKLWPNQPAIIEVF